MTARMGPIVALVIANYLLGGVSGAQYLGKFLGKLSELHHGVSGEVYAVDGRTLYLKDFTYDGQGPAAYFYASTARGANSAGFRLRDENGSPEVIRRYRKEGVTLTLPEGKTLNNVKIFYVWCEEFEVNFGDVKIPRSLDYPRPQKIEALKGVHGISSDNIVIVDAQTLLIPNFSYDGEAPDAKFWVGRGAKPSPQGIRIPDENGSVNPLRRYDRKTVVLTLPSDITVFDIGHFGVWCEAFTVDFGHVQIPQTVNVPPSLKMLGVTPQSKLNCEVLYDDLAFEVRWAIAGDSIVLQLVAKLDEREYMSFGISGSDSKSVMIGGDVVVAWVDKTTLKGFAEDYYLGEKSQCSGPTGSCPDNRLSDNTNNIRLLNAAMVNGYSIVTYQRPLRPSDEYDRPIYTNRSQAVIWGIGPLNQRNEVSFHSYYLKKDKLLDFGRSPKWNCPMPEGEQPPMKVIREPITEAPTTTAKTTIASRSRNGNNDRRRGGNRTRNQPQPQEDDSQRSASTNSRSRQGDQRRASASRNSPVKKVTATPAPVSKRDPWYIPPIKCDEPDDGVFYAQMGPTGGKHGYPAITGHVGWGISWYINGLLIPEINVVRGKSYNFVVEGGFDPDVPAKYHPFYITDDSVGGYEHKTPEEKKNIRIFAGVSVGKDGTTTPTGTGRLCHWTPKGDNDADDFDSFGAYQRTLELKCDQGEPGVIQWTPDDDTPDTVYYQCFTHRYLGWKINVLDSCDTQTAGSEVSEVVVPAPGKDLDESASLRVESRVKANTLITEEDEDSKDNQSTSVSEKSPLINPKPSNGMVPRTQLPITEPFLIQPQQSFYNTPQILMSHGPFLTHTYNPYIIDTPLYITSPSSDARNSNPLLTQIIRDELMTIMNATTVTSTTAAPKKDVVTPQFTGIITEKASTVMKKYARRPQNHRIKVVVPRPVVYRPKTYKKPMYRVPSRPLSLFHNKQVVPVPNPRNVEVSRQQASTEKPEIFDQIAKNTGFHTETLVVESDFRPMLRTTNRSPKMELEYESEVGLLPHHDLPPQKEVVFVRSTEGRPVKIERTVLPPPMSKMIARLTSVDERDEPIPAAAERVESYYLPPSGEPVRPRIAPSQRSEIDAEPPNFDLASPPDTVVTYDGRKVSGASLTVRLADRSSILDMRASKAAELIKARPQFAPFKGELPPLDPGIINRNAPQLQGRGVLSRDLDSPPVGGTTKLRAVRSADFSPERTKRQPHHTPEHTAAQLQEEKARNETDAALKSAGIVWTRLLSFNSIVVALFLKYYI